MPQIDYSSTHTALLDWYKTHGRHHLPWRNTDDPYAIYLSEIMLQQTQVTTVLERYYPQFLKRYPTLQSLADAPLDDVLKQWEGLGYYTRARNLHKTAQLSAPSLPKTVEELLALPGIGQNTAHAVASFAYHTPVPILEANVKRIIHRLFAQTKSTDKNLWNLAERILNKNDPFAHNQALMDIGSTICKPKNPRCIDCPLSSACQGKEKPETYPEPKAKKTTPIRKRVIIIPQYKNTLHLSPRSTNFLNGLYGFPEWEQPTGKNFTLDWHNTSISSDELTLIGGVTQTYSHFKLDATIYTLSISDEQHATLGSSKKHWYTISNIKKLALSRADEKVVQLFHAT